MEKEQMYAPGREEAIPDAPQTRPDADAAQADPAQPAGLEPEPGAASPGEAAAHAATMALAAAGEGEDGPKIENKEFLEAPFSYKTAYNESVTLANGSLQHTVTDFVLPGRNGFDFAAIRRYDSDSSGATEVNPNEGSGPPLTDERMNDHNLKTYGLGCGWSFVLPSIEIVPAAERNDVPWGTYSECLHLADGRNFVVEEVPSALFLRDHPFTDVTYEAAFGVLDHPCHALQKTYHKVIRYKNGCKDYFDFTTVNGLFDRYTLVAQQDRFGNTIMYTMEKNGGMEVVDTWGQTIKLKKLSETKMQWELPKGAQPNATDMRITYAQTNKTVTLEGGVKKAVKTLSAVTDAQGRVTSYAYYEPADYTAASGYSNLSRIHIPFLLLERIKHPTGAETRYQYCQKDQDPQYAHFHLGTNDIGGSREFFPLSRRTDAIGKKEYNSISYEYERYVGDEQRFKGKYIHWARETRPEGVTVEHTFNFRGQPYSHQTRHNGVLVDEQAFYYGGGEFDYKQLVLQVDKQFNLNTDNPRLEKITTWRYSEDKKRNVTSFQENYTEDGDLDTLTTMQYGPSNVLVEKTTLKTGATTIVERWTPRNETDGLPIYYQIFERNNDTGAETLKEKTKYDYSHDAADNNCLVAEHRALVVDGVERDDFTGCVTTQYAYLPAGYTHLPARKTICSMVDADEKALPDLSEAYTYDRYGRTTSVKNGRGHVTKTEYDNLGRQTRVTLPLKLADETYATRVTEYDDKANRITTADELGFRRRVHYTKLGQPAAVYLLGADANEPDVLLEKFTYNALCRLVTHTCYGEDGGIRNKTTYKYDQFGRVTAKTVQDAAKATLAKETHAYTTAFLPAGSTKPRSKHKVTVAGAANAPSLVTSTWTDQRGRVTHEYQPSVAVVKNTYDKLDGLITSTNALGMKTTYVTDHAGRVLRATRSADKKSTTNTYDPLGRKIAATDWMGYESTYVYDNAGRMLIQRTPYGKSSVARTDFFYDKAGNLVQQRVLMQISSDKKKWQETAYAYDALNRQTKATSYLDEAKTKYLYTTTSYDAAGNKTRLSTGGTETEKPRRAATYTYGRFGVLSVTDAMGKTERCAYDKIGLLTKKTDRCGNVRSYTYDGLGRVLTEKATPAGGIKIDQAKRSAVTKKTQYTLTGQKAWESVTENDETQKTSFVYDVYGRLVKQTDPAVAGKKPVKTYQYDKAGNRTLLRLMYNKENEIYLWYEYDKLGRLISVTRNAQKDPKNPNPIAKYTYDANGNRTKLEYPQVNAVTTYSYLPGNLMSKLTNKKAGETISSFTYTYLRNGWQTGKAWGDGRKVSYSYDRAGRLTKETDKGRRVIKYQYDAYGNRSRLDVAGEAGTTEKSWTTVYTYDANNRLETEEKYETEGAGGKTTAKETATYTYDKNGNQLRREVVRTEPNKKAAPYRGFAKGPKTDGSAKLDTRAYNAINQLIQVNRDGRRADYTYRADGLRHSRTSYGKGWAKAQTVYIWNGANLVEERKATGGRIARYLRGAGLICQLIGKTYHYYQFNGHGDVITRFDHEGNINQSYEYDSFGNEVKWYNAGTKANDGMDTDQNPFRYCGEYWDAELGEVYLRNRSYNASSGRFTSEDPIGDGENWYGYCANNPLSHKDPTGLSPTVPSGGGGILPPWKQQQTGAIAKGYVSVNTGTRTGAYTQPMPPAQQQTGAVAPISPSQLPNNVAPLNFGEFFGSGSTTVAKNILVDEKWNPYILPFRVTYGSYQTQILSKSGDSSKPISTFLQNVAYESRNTKIGSRVPEITDITAGIKFNTLSYGLPQTMTASISPSNISFSMGRRFDDSEGKVKLKISDDLTINLSAENVIYHDDDLSTTHYYGVETTLWEVAALVLTYGLSKYFPAIYTPVVDLFKP